jgi:hypothetical protein
MFDKREFSATQVEAFIDECVEQGYEVDWLEFTDDTGRGGSYRVYSREPGTKDPRLPGEPGFLPLGDLRGAPAEYQASLPRDYHQPLIDAERRERDQAEGNP